MNIFIKLAPRDYSRLRGCIPNESAAYEAIEKATRLDYSLGGVLFAGYSIPCDEEQARIILEIAKRCCPQIISEIEQAMSRGSMLNQRWAVAGLPW